MALTLSVYLLMLMALHCIVTELYMVRFGGLVLSGSF